MKAMILKNTAVPGLSMKDRRIIRELNLDSRQSFSDIGKKVGLPKSVVNYRINKLIEEGIITLFCTGIDRSRLGYSYWRLFLKFEYFSEELEKELVEFVSKLKDIHWVASLDGLFDFCIIFLAKGEKQVDDIYSSIIHRFGRHIIARDLSLATHQYYLPYNYLYDRMEYRYVEIKPKEKMISLDQKDLELINLIKENSRIPMTELIEKMSLSPQMIRQRLKALVKDRLITGFNIRIDHTKFLLHHFHTFLKLTGMSKELEKELITFLCSQRSTTHIIKGLGGFDLEFESVFQSHFELHDFLKQLKSRFPKNISSYESVLIYQVYPINTVKYG